MGTVKDSEATRAKIIEAAGQLFAERGLNGATVRNIVQRADTHLSALNYHFGGKDALYRAVLLKACEYAATPKPEEQRLIAMPPEAALFDFVKSVLEEYGHKDAARWEIVIIDRECWSPSHAFDDAIREFFKPEIELVAGIVGRAAGKPPASPEVLFAVLGMYGLLMVFGFYHRFMDTVAPGLRDFFLKRDWLVSNLVRITLLAARGKTGGGEGETGGRETLFLPNERPGKSS